MKHQIIICIAQPRSGSTFLMRLMNLRCAIGVRGDMPASFFEGLNQIWKACADHEGQYGSLPTYEKQSKLADEYRGPALNHEAFKSWSSYFLRNLMLGGSAGFMKTTQLGFGNDLVEPTVNMFREVCDQGGHELQLIFLTRDHDAIIKSLDKKWKEEDIEIDLDVTRGLLEHQQEQFKEASQLGDIVIDYDKFVADPKALLKRLNIKHVTYLEDEYGDSIYNRFIR